MQQSTTLTCMGATWPMHPSHPPYSCCISVNTACPFAYSRHNKQSPLTPQQGNAGTRPPQHVVDQIVDACSSWGFFQLVNHGVSQELIDEHYTAMKQ
jgi:hypothetical protein